jgi:hypothetical protein
MNKIYVCVTSYRGFGNLDIIVDMYEKAKKHGVELVIRPWKRNKVDMNLNMSVHEFLYDPKFKDCNYWVCNPDDTLVPYNFATIPGEIPTADVIFGWTIFGYPPFIPTIGCGMTSPGLPEACL